MLESQREAWKSAGYFAIPTASIKGAINHFQAGDFELVLLGHSISTEASKTLASVIRATDAHVPIACIAGSPGCHDSFADGIFKPDSTDLLAGMRQLLRANLHISHADC